MLLNLPRDLETLINKRLSSGVYTDAEDVVRRALEARDAEERWTNEERPALSAHVEGCQQAERGDLIDGAEARPQSSVTAQCPVRRIREIWNSNNRDLWERALDCYWTFVGPSSVPLEEEMDRLDVAVVKAMSPEGWYLFLLEKYFRWKYTAPNRYATTTRSLKSYEGNNELRDLLAIRDRLLQ